jgi:hypothetical protein
MADRRELELLAVNGGRAAVVDVVAEDVDLVRALAHPRAAAISSCLLSRITGLAFAGPFSLALGDAAVRKEHRGGWPPSGDISTF